MTMQMMERQGSALTIHPEQSSFTEHQRAALSQMGIDQAPVGDQMVFFHQIQRTGLDPFKREIYMIQRKGKWTIQTGIDGFYNIADRAARTSGGSWGIPETLWCGEDGVWRDVWLSKQAPAAAKVTVTRDGSSFTTVALTSEYKASGPMWEKMPARMIAKCAEALAIRRAFPGDLSGLYTAEEMAQADNPVRGAQRPPQRAQQQTPPPASVGAQGQANRETGEIPESSISGPTATALSKALEAGGVMDPDTKRSTCAALVGRQLATVKDLTEAEGQNLLGQLTNPVFEAEIVEEPPMFEEN